MLPRQTEERIDGCTNAEHKRGKPEAIYTVRESCIGLVKRELHCRRRDSGEERRDRRQVEQVRGGMLLRKANGWYTCMQLQTRLTHR